MHDNRWETDLSVMRFNLGNLHFHCRPGDNYVEHGAIQRDRG